MSDTFHGSEGNAPKEYALSETPETCPSAGEVAPVGLTHHKRCNRKPMHLAMSYYHGGACLTEHSKAEQLPASGDGTRLLPEGGARACAIAGESANEHAVRLWTTANKKARESPTDTRVVCACTMMKACLPYMFCLPESLEVCNLMTCSLHRLYS